MIRKFAIFFSLLILMISFGLVIGLIVQRQKSLDSNISKKINPPEKNFDDSIPSKISEPRIILPTSSTQPESLDNSKAINELPKEAIPEEEEPKTLPQPPQPLISQMINLDVRSDVDRLFQNALIDFQKYTWRKSVQLFYPLIFQNYTSGFHFNIDPNLLIIPEVFQKNFIHVLSKYFALDDLDMAFFHHEEEPKVQIMIGLKSHPEWDYFTYYVSIVPVKP